MENKFKQQTEERNHEVTAVQELLDEKGHIQEEGWARRPVWKYDRKKIHAGKLKIKEWDYYSINCPEEGWALCGTISDLGYAALYSISYIDYKLGKCAQQDAMKFLTLGRTAHHCSSDEDNSVSFTNKDIRLAFIKKGNKRNVLISAPELKLPDGRVGLDAHFTLIQDPDAESMNIATSWPKKRTAFYLNQKVNCMPAGGTLRRGRDTVEIAPDSAFGVLDWGRGRWTYRNTWYWGSGSGIVDGHSFGFNIGYGFSDRTSASENVLFYDGKVHKLNDIQFVIPKEGFMGSWKFTSSDGRFNMDFEPAVDRSSYLNAVVIKTVQHQVFGYFNGTAVLDDGTEIKLDRFPAFAEKVYNRY